MSDIVFILGAGASKKCGAPLMREFLDVAKHLMLAGSVNNKRADFERVFKAIGRLQAVHSKSQLDLTNIESIFTALEIANVLGKLPGFEPSEIDDVIASLKEVIVKTLETRIDFPTRRTSIQAPEPYGKFAELVTHLRGSAEPPQSVSVITFNYDIAVDMALHKAGLGPDYELDPPSGRPNPVPLLKLHGSLNWAAAVDTGEVRPLHLNEFFSKYSIDGWQDHGTCKLAIGAKLTEYFEQFGDLSVQSEPVIVPPTWNKADYHRSLSAVWSSAATNLSDARSIYVMGYSLPETDAFFRLLYALGTVGDEPLERFCVFNPDASGEVDDRFRRLLGPGAIDRYSYHSVDFDQAITEIMKLYPKRQ